MFNKIIWNKLKICTGIMLCTIATLITPAVSLNVYASEASPDVEVCADIIEWRYKIEDGKLYKALYNYSMGEYISDWQYVCDYPEGI